MMDDESDEERDAIKYLDGRVSDAAIGITKQYFARGEESLTEKQRYVFDKEVRPKIERYCKYGGCGEKIPVGELMRADIDGDYCYHHDAMLAKDEDELRRG